jgi:hypothetical protein
MLWILLFLIILCLVHIQFRYCAAVTICLLKVIETSLIVLAIQIYTMDLHSEVFENITKYVHLKFIPNAMSDL